MTKKNLRVEIAFQLSRMAGYSFIVATVSTIFIYGVGLVENTDPKWLIIAFFGGLTAIFIAVAYILMESDPVIKRRERLKTNDTAN